MYNIEMGDLVRVTDLGFRYSSYLKWLNFYKITVEYYKQSTMSTISSIRNLPLEFIVVFKGPHLVYREKELFYIESPDDPYKNMIVEKDGISFIRKTIDDRKLSVIKDRSYDRIEIGDIVKVEFPGEIYTNYDEWLRFNNVNIKNWCQGSIEIEKENEYEVVFIASHLSTKYINNRLLYIRSTDSGGEFIINQNGVRKIKGHRFNNIIEDIFKDVIL